jgi:hypothetical protein
MYRSIDFIFKKILVELNIYLFIRKVGTTQLSIGIYL